ncbi:MAG: 7-cyano-7-deazaguanine synthase QueC [Acidobacteria bacterium]|nr:7-cyano-7-deazaguanine synthase QueC [Acidobacteriota bacterium]MCL5287203.1 7-cyano-7-deazaguanine synthase QueC [Acidobacteriota bacterium]
MNAKLKAVVLLSGGMDSCVTAAMARETHEIAMVHASYGQRTEVRERRAFKEIADFYGVRERLVVRLEHFSQIGGSALTDTRIAVPERAQPFDFAQGMHAAPLRGEQAAVGSAIPVTYVPFRNAHFLSVAVSWAEVIGARAVFIGAVEEDSSGYPDCRAEYYRAFQQVVREGTRPETQIEIVTPVIAMRKSEIVRRGISLAAPLHLTWSCYQFGEEACGACESCVLRLRAFAEAGAKDSIVYRALARPR